MKNQLLERAIQAKNSIGIGRNAIPYTKDELELCIEYLQGRISIRQYAAAIELKSPGQITHRLAGLIRWGIQSRYLKMEIVLES